MNVVALLTRRSQIGLLPGPPQPQILGTQNSCPAHQIPLGIRAGVDGGNKLERVPIAVVKLRQFHKTHGLDNIATIQRNST